MTWGLGVAIREGQSRGELLVRGERIHKNNQHGSAETQDTVISKARPSDFASPAELRGQTGSSTTEVRKRIDKPRNTVDRQLQALHMLGVLTCDEEQQGDTRTVWRYFLADDIDPEALVVPDLLVPTHRTTERERGF